MGGAWPSAIQCNFTTPRRLYRRATISDSSTVNRRWWEKWWRRRWHCDQQVDKRREISTPASRLRSVSWTLENEKAIPGVHYCAAAGLRRSRSAIHSAAKEAWEIKHAAADREQRLCAVRRGLCPGGRHDDLHQGRRRSYLRGRQKALDLMTEHSGSWRELIHFPPPA